MIRFNPDNNRVQDFGGKGGGGVTVILHLCPGPRASSEWLTKEEAKGPCCILVDTSSLFCVKARWQKESLGQYCAAKAEGEGLRHGKHSSVPFAAAMANKDTN